MRRAIFGSLSVYVTLMLFSAVAQHPDNGEDVLSQLTDEAALIEPDLRRKLLGFWELQPKQTGSSGYTYRKCWGEQNWAITTYRSDGTIYSHHGGTYTLDGTKYTETIIYAAELTEDWIGRTYHFKIEIDDGVFKQTGVDNPWTETWIRLRYDDNPRETEVTEQAQ